MAARESKQARLDRFISKRLSIPRREVKAMLASGRITVDGAQAQDISQIIGQFTHVTLDDQTLQDNTPRYIMLNKPAGVVSATKDKQHRTVIDVLGTNEYKKLHIAGRLDFNSTGLLLLTNDGAWSWQLSSPENKVIKQYRVTLGKPLTTDYVAAFAAGMYFNYEGITTRPATLEIISDYEAVVGLTEGRYHQIKRMFGRFQNPVLTLHRFAIGSIVLDASLAPGQSRDLTRTEIDSIA